MPETTSTCPSMPAAPVAIVTASSKGMGIACARLLAQRGYHLALFARGPELIDLATELDALPVIGDLTDSVAIEQLVRQTQQGYGRIFAAEMCRDSTKLFSPRITPRSKG